MAELWPEVRALVDAHRARLEPPRPRPKAKAELEIPKAATVRKLEEPPDLARPWGDRPVPPRIMIDSDLHFDVQCPRFEATKLALAADWKPTHWLNLGDGYDFESVSSFTKDPARAGRGLQAEFDAAQPYWREVVRIVGAGNVDFILGNHEERLRKCLAESSGLFHLSVLADFARVAELPDGIVVHPYGTHVQVGPVWGEHGDRTKGQNPTHWAMQHRTGRVVAFGHTHRIGSYTRTMRGENGRPVTRITINTGHGCDPRSARYAGGAPGTNWQKSCTLVENYVDRYGDLQSSVHQIIAADDGSFSHGGRVYRA